MLAAPGTFEEPERMSLPANLDVDKVNIYVLKKCLNYKMRSGDGYYIEGKGRAGSGRGAETVDGK